MDLSNYMRNGAVAVRYKNRYSGEFTGNEYTYFTEIPLTVGTLVNCPTKYGVSLAKVTRIGVDIMTIPLAVRNSMKTITKEDLPKDVPVVEESEQLTLENV